MRSILMALIAAAGMGFGGASISVAAPASGTPVTNLAAKIDGRIEARVVCHRECEKRHGHRECRVICKNRY